MTGGGVFLFSWENTPEPIHTPAGYFPGNCLLITDDVCTANLTGAQYIFGIRYFQTCPLSPAAPTKIRKEHRNERKNYRHYIRSKNKISAAANEIELQNVKSAYISKQGALSLLLKELPKLDPALRPEMGKLLNQAKDQVKELIDAKKLELTLKASEVSPDFDCSVPGIMPRQGGLHPITQMCYDLNDTFRSMGFEIFQEDEIGRAHV